MHLKSETVQQCMLQRTFVYVHIYLVFLETKVLLCIAWKSDRHLCKNNVEFLDCMFVLIKHSVLLGLFGCHKYHQSKHIIKEECGSTVVVKGIHCKEIHQFCKFVHSNTNLLVYISLQQYGIFRLEVTNSFLRNVLWLFSLTLYFRETDKSPVGWGE